MEYWRDLLEKSLNKVEMKDLMSYIFQLSKVFHKNHYFILETKRRVIEAISQMDGYREGKVGEGYMERKVEYCRHMLEVQGRVCPGLSELRVYISNHLAVPLYWLSKVTFHRQQMAFFPRYLPKVKFNSMFKIKYQNLFTKIQGNLK